ncbi:MAG: bifunctional acetate--CoA ligase family protein/GNAT family N-acetyltransferase [Planctomycetes bacterium]|nr:bifunctional acetate--CoA ligase family protein/GNAT family N-acetyltransferase [Planctomycetota bacterium]
MDDSTVIKEKKLERIRGKKGTHPLKAIFEPETVAVIGATEKEGSVGRTLLWNLISHPFGGTVFPVNPKRGSVMGIKAYPRVSAVPEPVDLAVIVTPAPSVPELIAECVKAGVQGAIIISAGFKEHGAEGAELERRVLEESRRGPIRIIGPNCLGVMNPILGLNATFAGAIAKPGNVGFISQSGALCTAVLDWSLVHNVGFSAFVSIGSMLDIGWGDLIDYLGQDPKTQSIVIYMESIGDARSFLSAAREVALTKPIIVIKAGRTDAASKAAASHTGALTGSNEVLDAAFRRCGVLRVDNISDLFYMSEVLAKQPRPKGPKLTILTNAGGPGVLATDTLITGGGKLAELSEETFKALDRILPAHWSHNNPVDILGDAAPQRYAEALEIVAGDPNTDGTLVILTPQAMTDPTQTAEALKSSSKLREKPVLASWMGGADVARGVLVLDQADIPTFNYPDVAARVFNYMWKYSRNIHALYETPSLAADTADGALRQARAEELINQARSVGRNLLTEFESKSVLASYDIPTVDTRIASTEEAAAAAAHGIGYPVVVKIHSETITHKTDIGGVYLDLRDEEDVRKAYRSIESSVRKKLGAGHFQGVTVQPMLRHEGYEIILGSSIDPQFGPVILFGTGGQLVEVFKDWALALPPLNTTLARRLMEQTRIHEALKGVRGRAPVNLAALGQLVVRFSQLVVEQRWIKEIDINPLLASPQGIVALDARILLHDRSVDPASLPPPAIRPYPVHYVRTWKNAPGKTILLRPIRPEDEPLMVKFHETLSDRSVYFRYFHPVSLDERVRHDRLTRICFIDYNRQTVLVAEGKSEATGEREILGIGRLNKLGDTGEAEFAILVSDRAQRQGLGKELLRHLLWIAPKEKIHRVAGCMLPDNFGMVRICEALGFKTEFDPEEKVVKAELELRD